MKISQEQKQSDLTKLVSIVTPEENKWKWSSKRIRAVIDSFTIEQLALFTDYIETEMLTVEDIVYLCEKDKQNRPLLYQEVTGEIVKS